MSNIKILILSVIFLSCQKREQISYSEYYQKFNQINEYLDSNRIDLAIIKFDSLSKYVKHTPSSHLYLLARKCADNNLCDISAKYLKKSLQNGYEYGKGTGAYYLINHCNKEIQIVLRLESEIHSKNFNFEYKSLIDSMFQADQKARNESDYESMKIIDSMNMLTLLNQIEKYGYPGEKLIGHESALNAFIMILHMDRDINNQIFKPILGKAYNDGQLWPIGYAWIVDRRRAWGEEQLEPYYYHMPSKELKNFNTEQIREINRRRDSIGLEAL